MAIPTTRQEHIDYCLRRLGEPVIEVNVDEDQIGDCIDESLQYYAEFHFDGTEKIYVAHQITQADIDNEYFPIASDILSVISIIQPKQGFFGGFFNEEFQLRLSDFLTDSFTASSGSGTVLDFVITEQYINDIVDATSATRTFHFNKKQDRVFILGNWSDYVVGQYVVFESLRILDPEVYTEIYDDSFLKKYSTALIKKQWGINLKKYDGVQLPGGVTLNGQQIYDEAIQEIEQLQEEMQNMWQLPVDDFIG